MRRINNLFKNDNEIIDMMRFIRSGRLLYPDEVINQPKYLIKSRNFIIQNNALIYVPLNLPLIRNPDKQNALDVLYADNINSLGKGIDSFYRTVINNYLNITRKDVAEFLKSKQIYNLTRPQRNPETYVLPTYLNPRDMFVIDTIDITNSSELQYKHIFTIADVHSRYTFLIPLRNLRTETIIDAFQTAIIDTGNVPRHIRSDNGKAFISREFKTFLADNNIRISFNDSHNPVKVIENINGQVRKLIKELFIRTRNKIWARYLPEIQETMNNTVTRYRPISPDTLYNGNDNNKRLLQNERTRQQKERTRKVKHEFEVGERVRVNLDKVLKEYRQKKKQSFEYKNIASHWSQEVYEIGEIRHARNGAGSRSYTIRRPGTQEYLCTDKIVAGERVYNKMYLRGKDIMTARYEDEDEEEYLTHMQQSRLNGMSRRQPEILFHD